MTQSSKSNVNVFIQLFRKSESRHRRFFPILMFYMIAVGLFESLTMAWVAGFASWLADPASFKQNKIYEIIKGILPIIDTLDNHQFIVGGAALLTGLVLVKNILRGFSEYASARYSAAIQAKFGRDMMSEILFRPYIWFLDRNSADLQQLLGWRQQLGQFLLEVLRTMTNVVIVSFMLATLFVYNPRISLPIMGTITILSLLIFKIMRRYIDKQASKEKAIQQSTFRSSNYTIRAYKDVKIENVEKTFLSQFRNGLQNLVSVRARTAVISSLPNLLLEFIGFFALSVMIIILVTTQDFSTGETLSFMALIAVVSWRIIPAVNVILKSQSRIRTAIPFINAILEFLDEPYNTVESDDSDIEPMKLNQSLSLQELEFSYPTSPKPILNGLSIMIERGEKVGIIGTSGTGKTTLIDIIAGLLEPSKGHILVDGEPLNSGNIKNWQRSIGYMPQSPFIIPGTLAENVAFGQTPSLVDQAKIKEALKKASLDESRWNAEELLSETGRNLSGGQAQRMALARMFYRDSDILLIDEGTSSLDQETEAKILDDLFQKSSGKTIILITHRLSSLYRCERIISLNEGLVVADGAPIEILGALEGKS